MSYSKKEVEQIVKIHSLYQMSCVNWKGKTKKCQDDNGGEYYSEIIAESVLNNDKLLNLPQGTARNSFHFEHDGTTKRADSLRKEERFCLDCYKNRNSRPSPFGKIINYQVNIFKGTKINVDLVAYDGQNDTLWLIEVKGRNGKSEETLLRCALEIETYFRCLQPQKKCLLTTLSAIGEDVHTTENTKIAKGIWVPASSQAAIEYNDLNNRPKLSKLISEWGLTVKTY